MMKHIRGHSRRYFTLSAIAMYSTLYKLTRADSNYQYHRLEHKSQVYNNSPPIDESSVGFES